MLHELISILILVGLSLCQEEIQKQALTDFYNAMGGDGWKNKSGWLQGYPCPRPGRSDPAPWWGVNCDNGGYVTQLWLEKNNLKGTIPSDIFLSLPRLERFNVALNQISGTIPDSVCRGPRMMGLFLQLNTNLGGTLPSCLPNMPLLDTLIVEMTSVTGTLPQLPMHQLEVYIVGLSKLSGTIPDYFMDMPRLRTVILNGQPLDPKYRFSGTIPRSISQLPKLEALSLQFNNLVGSLPDLYKNLKSIQMFHVNNNNLTGTIPESIVNALNFPTTLLRLDPETGKDKEVACLGCQRTVHFENNRLSGQLPYGFGTTQGNVTEMGLFNNHFTGYIPEGFKTAKWRWFPTKGTALSKNPFLPPIPAWAVPLGAHSVSYQIEKVNTPYSLVSRPNIENVTITATKPTKNYDEIGPIGCGYVRPGHNPPLGSECKPPDCIVTPAEITNSAKSQTYKCQTALLPDMLGFPGAVLVYTGYDVNKNSNSTHIISHPKTGQGLLVYEHEPRLLYVDPEVGRVQGCTSITIHGKDFVETKQIIVNLNETPLECSVPSNSTIVCNTPALNESLGNVLDPIPITMSPNNGSSWASIQNVKKMVFRYHNYCAISPKDNEFTTTEPCPCGQCPCSTLGACLLNWTDLAQPPTCKCFQDVFTGEDCSQCIPFHYGHKCEPCDCINGKCSEGRQGDGYCKCDLWYSGKNCSFYYKWYALVPSCLFAISILVLLTRLRRKRLYTEEKVPLPINSTTYQTGPVPTP